MSEWKEVKIGDISERLTSGGTPSTKVDEYYNGDIPWLNTKEVNFNRIWRTEKLISEKGLQNSSAKWIKENSVIVAMYGATAAKVAINKIPLTTNQACCNIIIDNSKANYEFIFYSIWNKYDELENIAVGAAQQNLSVGVVKDFDIMLPPLPEQNAIASVLSSLDNKIDLLHRQNATLEKMAETLFRQWFVEEAKEEWEVTTIGKQLVTVLGGTPSTIKPEYWDGDIPWINSGEINRFRIDSPTRYITTLGFDNSSTKLLPKGTTVIAITGATLGQISLLEIDTCANQSVIGILPNDRLGKEFVFFWVKYKLPDILLNETGGAQPHINKNDVNKAELILPPNEFLKSKTPILADYFIKISKNIQQIRTLTQMRDILLPKLMNGELRVNTPPPS
ncbi:MAG: restriction endonuclease subunit S [Bacteroidales bacterium]